MTTEKMTTAHIIKIRLEEAFLPTQLEVIDESDKHIGHLGHQGGGRHFAIVIAADAFKNLSRIAAHREIYALLNDLMPDKLHALRICVL
jgi:BolA protein